MVTPLFYCIQIIISFYTTSKQQQEVPTCIYLMGCAQHLSAPYILQNICQLCWPTDDCAGGMQLWIRPSCRAEIPEHYTTDISTWHLRSPLTFSLTLTEWTEGEHFSCMQSFRLKDRSNQKIMNTINLHTLTCYEIQGNHAGINK